MGKLNAKKVEAAKAGVHGDGDGLYLDVKASGARSWIYRFMVAGKGRWMGLGAYPDVTLGDARDRAAEARKLLKSGVDPIAAAKVTPVVVPTFGAMADAYIEAHKDSWRNAKHVEQWRTTLTVDAAALAPMPVDKIDSKDVLAVLSPIWQTKNETARRLRGRIEAVLDMAKAQKHRSGDNPAAWRGNLDHLLAKRQRIEQDHHAALPYEEVGALIAKLHNRASTAAIALEFAILTAARAGEVLGARWEEIDLDDKLWSIPGERMKGGKTHVIPLSDRALEILRAVSDAKTGDYVFPGRDGGPLSDDMLRWTLRRCGAAVTVHGFRSSFRDWAGNETPTPFEIAEAALAHTVGDKTVNAYRRDSALEKRRALMQDWAAYVGRKAAGNVVAFVKSGAA